MSNRYGIADEAYQAALSAFHAAIARAPGQVAFANVCRCTQGNISLLVSRKSLLPARYVPKVEAAFGIDRSHLRPDLYPTSSVDLAAVEPLASSDQCDPPRILHRRQA